MCIHSFHLMIGVGIYVNGRHFFVFYFLLRFILIVSL